VKELPLSRWNYCANASFFGQRRDRFTEYQPARTLSEKFALVAATPGLRGIELKYPLDFDDPARVRALLDEHALTLSAVNVDIKDARHFRHGALSARDVVARDRAVSLLREGMDVAAAFGIDLVSTCPLADGHDYPFQVSHADAWEHFIDSVRRAAIHRDDVRLALEFQPHEPHARIMLANVGKLLYVCQRVGRANVGANFDVGHSFAALETPAESAALLAREGRLFYVHSNDNTGDGGDWDMVSGSVHFWHWLELLATLHAVDYRGWIGGDVMPKHFAPEQGYGANVAMIDAMWRLIESFGIERLRSMTGEPGVIPALLQAFSAALTGASTNAPVREVT
jgi:xylose isomerase